MATSQDAGRIDLSDKSSGQETAASRYERLASAGAPTGWAGFCSTPHWCTSPCRDCAQFAASSD